MRRIFSLSLEKCQSSNALARFSVVKTNDGLGRGKYLLYSGPPPLLFPEEEIKPSLLFFLKEKVIRNLVSTGFLLAEAQLDNRQDRQLPEAPGQQGDLSS